MDDIKMEKLITYFDELFQALLIDRHKEAAKYYVGLIKNDYPMTIKSLSEQPPKMSYPVIISGRNELLKKGFIAKILTTVETELPSKKGELYIPVSPMLIWEQYSNKLDRLRSNQELTRRGEEITNELKESYERNFKKFGVSIDENSNENHISLFYSSEWFFNTIVYNLKPGQSLSMLLGGLKSFQQRYLPYYEKLLIDKIDEKRILLKILYNNPIKPKEETKNYDEECKIYKKEVEDLRESRKYIKTTLLKTSPKNIEFKVKKVPHATTRRIIYEDYDGKLLLAIDADKILNLEEEQLEDDTFYLATIYIRDKDIYWLKVAFDEAWDRSDASLDFGSINDSEKSP